MDDSTHSKWVLFDEVHRHVGDVLAVEQDGFHCPPIGHTLNVPTRVGPLMLAT